MQYSLRPYQQQASDSAVRYLENKAVTKGAGLIVLPTGSGKSLVIADIVNRLDDHVLILQPSKEILEQNFQKLVSYGHIFCSIYSASCGQKRISKATFATIGSVYKKPEAFKHFQYVIVDEAHLVNESPDSMYMQFFKALGGVRCVGLTATPYRLYSTSDGQGNFGSMLRFLTRLQGRFFTTILHSTEVGELLHAGYLAKTNYYAVDTIQIDRLKVNSTGQGYTDKSIRDEYRRSGFSGKLANVVERLLYNAQVPRRGILVFTQFIEESEELIQHFPDISAMVTGETPKRERERILADFKAGKLKVVANVGTLTTGFDYPELDTIVVARPTRSLSLWYQIVGRAIRPHASKQASWVVDLCGTYRIFGKVEDLEMVDTSPDHRGLWQIRSNGRPLTNVLIPAN